MSDIALATGPVLTVPKLPAALRHAPKMALSRLLGLGALAGLSLVIFALYDVRAAAGSLAQIKTARLADAFLLTLLAIGLGFVRFTASIRLLGFTPASRPALRAFLIGQFSNQFLANVFGQSLSRAAILKPAGVPFSVTVFATWIERLIAALMLLALSGLGAMFFLGTRVFGLDVHTGGAYFLSLAAGLLVAAVTVVGVLLSRHAAEFRASGCGSRRSLWFAAVGALTMAIHGATLGSFMLVLDGLGIDPWRLDIAAALVIVMFTTSLPISFSGWGLRELSAAHALGLVGVAAPPAIAGAAAIGILALLATMLTGLGLLGLMAGQREATAASLTQPFAAPGLRSGETWDQTLLWACSLMVAGLILFQIRVPAGTGFVSANPADIVALTALGIALASRATSSDAPSLFQGWMWRGMGLMSVLMLAGLISGYAHHGWNDWAIFNRGAGWLALVGYVAAGSAAGLAFGARGRATILLALVAVGVTVIAGDIGLQNVHYNLMRFPRGVVDCDLDGFTSNRNAFALQLLFMTTCVAALYWTKAIRQRAAAWALALAAFGIVGTHSRTGQGLAVLLLAGIVWATPKEERWALVRQFCLGFTVIALVSSLSTLMLSMIPVSTAHASASLPASDSLAAILRPESDGERMTSIVDGFGMWLSAPVFGHGLGSFVASRLAEGKPLLVIHSVPVWLLAEFGAAGFLLVAAVAGEWTARAARLASDAGSRPWALGFLALMGVMMASGLAHDMFYQRGFWFLAGLFGAAMLAEHSGRTVRTA